VVASKVVVASEPAKASPVARPVAAAPAAAIAPTKPNASMAADAPGIEGRAAADRWAALVQRLAEAGAISAMVRELAMQAQALALVDGVDAQRWQLRVERENLRAPALRERLQAAASQHEGLEVRLEIEAGAVDDTPALRDSAERDRRQAEAERVIHDDPLVQALMAQYKTARIVPGSVKPH
jgi:DNA polymerase III subunit gamma/tau